MPIVKGEFRVMLWTQQPDSEAAKESTAARRSMAKVFEGDLAGKSNGEMLGYVSTETQGSGGYVAMEKFEGTLGGKTGSFLLQHNATMTRGVPYLNVIVIPDSATGELTGLSGTMKIDITGGKHLYEFDYQLP